MLIKVHAMHVMLCVGPVSGPAVQHMYVCTVQCTVQHSTVQCIVHVCILAWCRVMSPAQPCALCWLACTKIALLQCSRQLDIKELTIKNIICHLPVRLWGDQRKPLNAVSRIILVPYEVPVSRIILYNCCYSFRTVEC